MYDSGIIRRLIASVFYPIKLCKKVVLLEQFFRDELMQDYEASIIKEESCDSIHPRNDESFEIFL